MRRLAPVSALLVLVALLLALGACGQTATLIAGNSTPSGASSNDTPASQPTVEINDHGLSETSFSVPESQNIAFVNGTKSDEQRLCIGKNGICDMNNTPGAPPELLSGGFLLQPGTTRVILFNQPGTYHLTVASNRSMNVTVTVHG